MLLVIRLIFFNYHSVLYRFLMASCPNHITHVFLNFCLIWLTGMVSPNSICTQIQLWIFCLWSQHLLVTGSAHSETKPVQHFPPRNCPSMASVEKQGQNNIRIIQVTISKPWGWQKETEDIKSQAVESCWKLLKRKFLFSWCWCSDNFLPVTRRFCDLQQWVL